MKASGHKLIWNRARIAVRRWQVIQARAVGELVRIRDIAWPGAEDERKACASLWSLDQSIRALEQFRREGVR